mgnify:CR=1 FL=1
MKNKRVFVSGGAGVIGRSLVPLLCKMGAKVYVGDLEEIPQDFPSGIVYRNGDLNDLTQSEIDQFDPEIFIHLAATFERSEETYGHWEENFQHNIKLSHHLITLIRNCSNIQRVVNASSYLIYDKSLYQFQSPKNEPYRLKETDPINPRNLTGLSKLGHEIELDFLSKFNSDKFSSVSARIYRGYGTNSRDIISRWIRALLNDQEITVFNEDGYFDYMYAEDTALGLLKLAQSDVTGVINLGTGHSRKVKDVINILSDYFPDMKLKKIDKPGDLIEASEADINLLKEVLGWVPSSKLEETIPVMIEYERSKSNLTSSSYKNVLITSISAKVSLVKSVRAGIKKISKKIKIFGGDIQSNVVSSYFVDEFWEMPKLNQENIEDFIQNCISRNIGLIIPSRDGELEFFSKNKATLLKHEIHVMISEPSSIINCVDKLEFSNIRNLSIIPSSESINDLNAVSYVVKERFGAGSESIGINLAKDEAINHSKNLQNPIFQPFIKGKEFSVDAYIDMSGVVKGIIIRERVLVINGESQITKTKIDQYLEDSFKKIITSLNLYGHVILQAILDDNQNIHVIECNPRFGGASAISVKSGLDSFYWTYLESRGISIEKYPFHKPVKEITQIRSHKDTYL